MIDVDDAEWCEMQVVNEGGKGRNRGHAETLFIVFDESFEGDGRVRGGRGMVAVFEKGLKVGFRRVGFDRTLVPQNDKVEPGCCGPGPKFCLSTTREYAQYRGGHPRVDRP